MKHRYIIDYCPDYKKRQVLRKFVQTLWKLEIVDMEYYDAFYNSILLGG